MFTDAPVRAPRPWPRAAVFDCDGLLVDSTACWAAAYGDLAARVGRRPTVALVDRLHGASAATAADALTRELGHPVSAALVRAALIARFTRMPVGARPGAAALLAALGRTVPIAVASNAPLELVALALRRSGLAGLVATVVSAEEVGRPKPAPDVYLEACRRIAADPSDAIAFEDSTRGAAAAVAAGLFVVGVPSSAADRPDADLVVPHLGDPRIRSLFSERTEVWRRRPEVVEG